MANTYTQIYVHVVFAVKGRANLIPENHREELCKYITGIIKNKGGNLIAIHAMPDHSHLLIRLKPDLALSDLIRDVKHFSTNFINDKKWIRGRFCWQAGFGAFSHSQSQVETVSKYIRNQDTHHRRKNFKTEYLGILKNFNIEYDEKYVFDWISDR